MNQPVDMDGAEIARLVDEACVVLGRDWVNRRLRADQLKRAEARAGNHRRRMIRYTAHHLFVQWLVQYQDWHATCLRLNTTEPNQEVILLATFARNVAKAKGMSGFDHVLARLLRPSEFLAASFEVEVATAYLNRQHSVEFVETEREKSPDLKVTRSDGAVFWVECKRRDDQTERDGLISSFWDELKQALYRKWGPAKANVALVLRSHSDPERQECAALIVEIFSAAEELLASPNKTSLVLRRRDRAGKYEFELRFLCAPDVEQDIRGIRFPDDYLADISGEIRPAAAGLVMIRNPVHFLYKNAAPSDRYTGAMNSFKAATEQLPADGPGVIWIRVPYPDGYPRAQADLEALAGIIAKELSGNHNTRVNAVVLSTRVFSNEPNQGKPAMTYRHASAAIEHRSPKAPLPPLPVVPM